MAAFLRAVFILLLAALLPAQAHSLLDTDCAQASHMVFAAHMDDDLLFMNPDLSTAIGLGDCLRVVYLTASDRGRGVDYMLERERGVRAAYAMMAGAPDVWDRRIESFGTRRVVSDVLSANPRIALMYLRISDPWLGSGWGSLTPLSALESLQASTAQSLGAFPETYTRAGLLALLADMLRTYRPSMIRSLDDTIPIPYVALCWRCPGDGHPDHMAGARLVREIMANTPISWPHSFQSYVDYPSQERPPNLARDEITNKTSAFLAYARQDSHYCDRPGTCAGPQGPEAAWVERLYYVAARNTPAHLAPAGPEGFFMAVLDERAGAAATWQSGSGQWTTWGGRSSDPVSVVVQHAGGPEVLARDSLGRLWAGRRVPHAGAEWTPLPGPRVLHPPVVGGPAPRAAAGLGVHGRFHVWEHAQGAWLVHGDLPSLAEPMPFPALARDAQGRLHVFAWDRRGRLWATRESTSGDGSAGSPGHEKQWKPWRRLPAPLTSGGLGAGRNQDGLIALFFRSRGSGHLMRMMQKRPMAGEESWTSAVDQGFPYVFRPVIAFNEKGRLAAAVLERLNGALRLVEEERVTRIPGRMRSMPALLVRGETLMVIARSDRIHQQYRLMRRRRGAWAAPVFLPAPHGVGGWPFAARSRRDTLQGPILVESRP